MLSKNTWIGKSLKIKKFEWPSKVFSRFPIRRLIYFIDLPKKTLSVLSIIWTFNDVSDLQKHVKSPRLIFFSCEWKIFLFKGFRQWSPTISELRKKRLFAIARINYTNILLFELDLNWRFGLRTQAILEEGP